MSVRSLVAFCVVLLGGAAIAGCGGGSSVTNGPPVINCTLPGGTSVAVLYPIPNATQVPDSIATVVLAISPPLPSNWQVLLLNQNATYAGSHLQTGTPVPLPTPIAPAPNGSTIQYSTVTNTGGLASNLVYQVALNDTNSGCNSYPTFSSFTSQ